MSSGEMLHVLALSTININQTSTWHLRTANPTQQNKTKQTTMLHRCLFVLVLVGFTLLLLLAKEEEEFWFACSGGKTEKVKEFLDANPGSSCKHSLDRTSMYRQ